MPVVHYDNNQEKEILIRCSCGCSILSIEQEKEDGVVIISHYIASFYSLQEGFLFKLKEMLKAIFSIFLGKEYRFYEIVLTDLKDVQKLKNAVSTLRVKEDIAVENLAPR
jgi:hypothetical protein